MRIVCAVDGSVYAERGIQALQALACREPQHVILLHVVDPTMLQEANENNPVAVTRALAALDKTGNLLLRNAEQSARAALTQAGTSLKTKLRTVLAHGPLANTIVRQAKRLEADLILMGSRGLSDIEGFLLGSISRQVATVASCSLLVVKQPLTKISRVTLAVDDSKHSRAAARFLRTRILSESATVSILTAVESPVTELAPRYLSASHVTSLTEPAMERAASFVNGLRDDFVKDGYHAVSHVRMNPVIDTIVTHVEAGQDDLLVFGSRKLSKTEQLHLGSVSETLLRHAPCSVLIVRGARA